VSLIGRNWQQSSGWPLKVAASSAPDQLQLLGVRRCGSSRGRVAHILYHWRGEPLSVYVLNGKIDVAQHAGGDHDVIRLGEHAIVWADHGRTYAVVASQHLPELRRVAVYVRRGTE
jgi:anti-sigma factor RsiW